MIEDMMMSNPCTKTSLCAIFPGGVLNRCLINRKSNSSDSDSDKEPNRQGITQTLIDKIVSYAATNPR